MRYRMWLLGLLCVSLVLTIPAPVKAVPIIFTDRAAFNAAVSGTTLITFDTQIPATFGTYSDGSVNPSFYTATIDNLLSFSGDREAFNNQLVVPGTPGNLCMCGQIPGNLVTLGPVLAFGIDIIPMSLPTVIGAPPVTNLLFAGMQFQLSAPSFLGVLYTEQEASSVGIGRVLQQQAGVSGLVWSTFSIDNVAIKTVPEPSATLLLGLGLVSLVAWPLWRRRSLTN